MGITGLIGFMEKASSKVQIKDLRGSTVAVDTYCWLHKGAFACADKIARKEETDVHIQYCLKYVNMLLSHDIKPILVFDGRHLPAKALTENKRREARQSAKIRAAELLRAGKTEEAKSHLRRSVNITHAMALKLIQACRSRNVDCVVAPYEADGQLAYLNTNNIADYVITEDSDLVLFGCTRIIFKLDLTGNGLLVEANKLHLTMGCREDKFTLDRFRNMCILSGCDYMDSISGIGLAKACKFIMMTEDPDIKRALSKMPAYLKMNQLVVSEEYKESFVRAVATFKHMFVYNPIDRKLVRLNDLAAAGTDLTLCCNAGEFMEDEVAFQLAIGNLDPFTMEQVDDWHPDDRNSQPVLNKSKNWGHQIAKHPSIWQPDFRSRHQKKGPSEALKMVKTIRVKTVFAEDETEEEKNSSIELLIATYNITDEPPPSKRVCTATSQNRRISCTIISDSENSSTITFEANDTESTSTTPIIYRNPFAKSLQKTTNDKKEQSPTKIKSLLKNITPVKRNPSIFSKTSNKLSKFTRTIVDDKQKVVSRFFAAGGKKATTPPSKEESVENDEEMTSVLVPVLKTPPPRISLNEHSPLTNHNDNCPGQEEDMTNLLKNIHTQYTNKALEATKTYLTSPEAVQKERGDTTPKKQQSTPVLVETEDLEKSEDDIIDCDAYEVKPVRLPIGKSSSLLRQQQLSNRCRVSGMMKSKKGQIKPVVNQGTLSMFGFQKKPQLKH